MEPLLAWIWLLLPLTLLLILFLVNWRELGRKLVQKLFRSFVKTLMTDIYDENLLELFSAVKRTGFHTIMELNLRAEQGRIIERPLGTGRKFPNFSGLMFDVAQLHRLPEEDDTPVDTKIVLGPRARKPLTLETPIIVSGMAFGTGLSAKAKIALARGAALAGTANNSGEGPFLQEERDNARYWILQYNRGFWNKDPEILRQADAIEIQLGQGAMGGLSHRMRAEMIDERLQRAFPISPGRDAVVRARHREMHEPEDIINLVKHIRSQVDGVPVGIKMASSKYLESDLALALKAEVDFIALCGVQAGTRGSPASLQDDHGLPTLFALTRAVRFLEKHHAKDKLTLIIDGGFTEPGEMLKALALGADAVYIGTAALFAISHTQIFKSMPWEPPTQIVWYNGKFADQYDENIGAQNLANFIKACTAEIASGLRVMGKTSIRQVSKEDMFAIDQTTAEITGVPLGYHPYKHGIIHLKHRKNRERRRRRAASGRQRLAFDTYHKFRNNQYIHQTPDHPDKDHPHDHCLHHKEQDSLKGEPGTYRIVNRKPPAPRTRKYRYLPMKDL